MSPPLSIRRLRGSRPARCLRTTGSASRRSVVGGITTPPRIGARVQTPSPNRSNRRIQCKPNRNRACSRDHVEPPSRCCTRERDHPRKAVWAAARLSCQHLANSHHQQVTPARMRGLTDQEADSGSSRRPSTSARDITSRLGASQNCDSVSPNKSLQRTRVATVAVRLNASASSNHRRRAAEFQR